MPHGHHFLVLRASIHVNTMGYRDIFILHILYQTYQLVDLLGYIYNLVVQIACAIIASFTTSDFIEFLRKVPKDLLSATFNLVFRICYYLPEVVALALSACINSPGNQ